jgi:tRNA-modifying protein YgfZ
VLGGVSFQKGCYTGQEIIARTQYLGRLKERLHAFHADAESVEAAARVYSATFGNEQPCGTVVEAAPAPAGGSDLLAVVQQVAADANDIRLGQPDGIALERRPLPYPVPQAGASRKPVL